MMEGKFIMKKIEEKTEANLTASLFIQMTEKFAS